MTGALESRTLSVYIDRPFRDVYDFLSAPENFPAWASGLSSSLERAGDEWVAETPQGRIKVRFTAPNSFGVLDHTVTAESGEASYIPMRVIARAAGAEVLFTLLRQPDWSDERFAQDATWIERDLAALKQILET